MRETKIIKTKNGHEVEVYTYMTGGDMKSVQTVSSKFAEYTGKLDANGNPEIKMDFSKGDISELENNLINRLVVKVDGKDATLELVDELPAGDYTEIKVELDRISADSGSKKA